MPSIPWLKIIGAGVVIAPVCAYGGLYVRESQLAKSVDSKATGNLEFDRANKARVVELAKERQQLLRERDSIDAKIVLSEKRMALEKAQQA